MKPAADVPESQITETTIRKRTVPAIIENRTPDLWEYLRAIAPMDWPKHMVYGYRVEPSPKVGIFKCSEAWVQMPNGKRVQVADEQEMEFALQENFGGGTFRILVKAGPQIVTAGNIAVNAPPRAITIPVDNGNGHNPTGGVRITTAESDVSSIAGKAIDAVAGQEHQAVRIGMEALGAAANVVRSFSDGRPQGGDDMTRQFMALMMARLAQDPMEQLVKLLTVMREMNGVMGGGNGSGGPLVDKLLGAAVDRFMNPAPNGAPVSPMAELVRQFPQVGGLAVEGLREFRLAREAEARIASMQQQRPVAIAQPNPQVLPATTTPAAPVPTQNGGGAPTMEFLEQKIMGILQQPISANQAADEVLSFLTPLDPAIVDQLARLGETGLVALFQNRPLLKPATNNMPRLVEFIRAFLKMHAEDVAADGQDAQQPKSIAPHGNA